MLDLWVFEVDLLFYCSFFHAVFTKKYYMSWVTRPRTLGTQPFNLFYQKFGAKSQNCKNGPNLRFFDFNITGNSHDKEQTLQEYFSSLSTKFSLYGEKRLVKDQKMTSNEFFEKKS